MGLAALPDWESWPLDAKLRLRDALRVRQYRPWREVARPEQLVGDAYLTIISGGRGSGKTRSGAEWMADALQADGPADVSAIIAPTFGEARDKCVEGKAGLLPALRRRGVDARWNRSIGELYMPSGAKVLIDQAFDGALKVQGENLRRAWCDEVGLWRPAPMAVRAWDESLMFAIRDGADVQIVCTFTPKRTVLAKRLLGDPHADIRRMRTEDNAANLNPEFLRQVVAAHAGTRLGMQELEGILLEDVEGALWQYAWIDDHRRQTPPYLWQKRRVALDPSDGLEDGDEQGVAVVGQGGDWGLYVIESYGLKTDPYGMCVNAVSASERHGRCPIVVEKNHGGAALKKLLEMAMREIGRTVPFQMITASKNKMERADPISVLYQQGRVHHLGRFPKLEEQMTTYTGASSEPSPDRLDALVHGLTELMGGNIHGAVDPETQTAVPWRDKPTPMGAVPWT